MLNGRQNVCIEDKNTATLLLKDDRVVRAPVKSLLDAFPECEEKDLEKYLLSLCSPTLVVQCTFKGSDLIAMKFQVLEHTWYFLFVVCSECAIHSHTICNTSYCCFYHHNIPSCFVYTRGLFCILLFVNLFFRHIFFSCLDQTFWHYFHALTCFSFFQIIVNTLTVINMVFLTNDAIIFLSYKFDLHVLYSNHFCIILMCQTLNIILICVEVFISFN